jgi:hypothetical protein
MIEKIYVYLPDELVEVWRPVLAERVEGNQFRIVSQPYDPADEPWQFMPGDIVTCEVRDMVEGTRLGPALVATALVRREGRNGA